MNMLDFGAFESGLVIGAFCLYFLPSLIGFLRGHENTLAIFLLNLVLGWTLLGWMGALIWSVMN